MSRRFARVVGAALASVSLASLTGCWPQIGFDAGHTRHNDRESMLTAANVDTLSTDWSVDLGYEASEPIVRGTRLFLTVKTLLVGGAEVHARAIAARTGAPVWDQAIAGVCCNVPSAVIGVAPTFVGDRLWTGSTSVTFDPRTGIPSGSSANPQILDPADGATLERAGGGFTGSPTTQAGEVAVGTVVLTEPPWRMLEVRDARTAAVVWTAPLGGSFGTAGPATAVVDGQIFVMPEPGGGLMAFDLDGCGAATCAPTWSRSVGAVISTAPVAAPGGDSVFVAAETDLVAVDRATGATSWTGPLGSAAPGLAIADDTVLVAVGTRLSAFAAAGCGAATCTPAWTADLAGPVGRAGPIVAGGVVYVGEEGAVEAFPAGGCGAATCSPLAQVAVAGTPEQMSLADGRLFVVHRTSTTTVRLTAFAANED